MGERPRCGPRTISLLRRCTREFIRSAVRAVLGLESLAVPRRTILYFGSAVVFCAALAVFWGVAADSVLSDFRVPAVQATSPSGSQKQSSPRLRVAEGQYDIFQKEN